MGIIYEDKEYNEMFDRMIKSGVFTEEELNLLTGVNGATVDTLQDALFYRIGSHDIDDLNWA